ncbi:hypothetical protein FOA43_002769 [Brettanomyces nanus]|uniref:Uncharacterized protein n=1 Tax=Eeniella nana TaxID=13502 RepID=A0A875S4X7_EENNA|nr:uncharacterized protein FOA43_002769 [Brettanomyces nanus]QPG75415.1 hypothetical protein FOA43_002769 [Brettanomyces nanus]
MVTYKLYSKQINKQVRIEAVYENYPVIAGTDELSILVRFKYTGKRDVLGDGKYRIPRTGDGSNTMTGSSGADGSNEVAGSIDATGSNEADGASAADGANGANGASSATSDVSSETGADKNSSTLATSSWGRLSMQLSNATRSLFLAQSNSIDENTKQEEEQEEDFTMYLGYSQVLGYYTVNDKIVDFKIFEQLQKSTIIGGKFAGIDTLNANVEVSRKGGFVGQLSTLLSTDINAFGRNIAADIHMIPFYSTTQSIMFSEMKFQAKSGNPSAESRSFYLNYKLPKDLPPCFQSVAGSICYQLVLGYQVLEDGVFVQKTIMIPLKIQPNVDKFGRQPLFHLEKVRLNVNSEKLVTSISKEVSGMHSRHGSAGRLSFKNMRSYAGSIGTSGHRSSAVSFDMMKREIGLKGRVMSDGLGSSWNRRFLELMQELDKSRLNEVNKVQEKFDAEMNQNKVLNYNARESLIHIMADYKSVQRETFDPLLDEEEGIDYISMVPQSEQTKYLIKQNHLEIGTLEMDKSVFKVGDPINLSIDFQESDIETKGLEIQLIRSQIFYREEYLKRGTYGEVYEGLSSERSLETVIYEKLTSTFDSRMVNDDLLIPLETEPQFKTNYFDVRYFIQVRFVLLDQYGVLKRRKEAKAKSAGADTEDGALLEDLENLSVKPPRKLFDLHEIFMDKTGSMLFKAKEDFESGYEFTVRIPIVVLPNYEQDFGSIIEL